jgi:hypothetical protein
MDVVRIVVPKWCMTHQQIQHNFKRNTTCKIYDWFGMSLAFKKKLIDFWCFNDTFNNISATSWRQLLAVEEAGVPGENHRPWVSNW